MMRIRIKRLAVKLIVFCNLLVCIYVILKTNTFFANNGKGERPSTTESPSKVQRAGSLTRSRDEKSPPLPDRSGALIESLDTIDGPGAKGKKLDVLYLADNPAYKRLRNQSMHLGVNVFLGNIIGGIRVLEDKRMPVCKSIVYPKNLPPASVVIVCRDEAVSTLARTIFGALYSSPDHLLKEIVLVDDGSVNEELIVAIRIYEESISKLRVVRNQKPTGLMRARQIGIEATTSDYFIVLDSHIEFNIGWLEPILNRLVEKPKHCLTSFVGGISSETFEYSATTSMNGFICFEQITVNEQWVHYSEEFLRKRNESHVPIATCMFPGMMMAMKKDFFLQIGGLDTGMEIWGSEHMELSVRVWRCGGKVEFVPCSLIAHLYRTQPWQAVHKSSRHILKNKLRTIEIAMEGVAKKIALDYMNKMPDNIEAGDLVSRRQLLLDNQCKGYDFFKRTMQSLTNELYFPESPKNYGPVYNRELNKCFDCARIDDKFVLIGYTCTGQDNQYFVLTENGQIKVRTLWMTLNATNTGVQMRQDPDDWYSNPIFKWTLTGSGEIRHTVIGKCLTMMPDGRIDLHACYQSPKQTWEWPKREDLID